MLTLRYPGLPQNGELVWERLEVPHVEGQSLSVYLGGVDPVHLNLIVVSGQVVPPADLATFVPTDGDEVTIVPRMGGGSKGGIIAGIVGAIVAVAYYYVTHDPRTAYGIFQAFTGGFAMGTMLFSLVHPPKGVSGSKTGTLAMWDGISNQDKEGIPVPVVLGEIRTGGVRVDSFIRVGLVPDVTNGTVGMGEQSWQLILVSKAHYGIEALSDLWINGEPVANFPSASWWYTLGETPEQWYYGPTGVPVGANAAGNFGVSANTYAQGIDVTLHPSYPTPTPYIYTTTPGTLVTALELIFAFPSGLVHTHSGSDESNTTRFRVRYRAYGTSGWTNSFGSSSLNPGVWAITLTQRAPYVMKVRLDGLTPGRYDVEVTWGDGVGTGAGHTSDHTDSANDAWVVIFNAITEEVGKRTPKPGYALVGVGAIAVSSLQGQPPTITVHCRGNKIPWHNGTSYQTPTWRGPDYPFAPIGRNPAWIALEAHRDRDDPAHNYVGWGLGTADKKIYLPDWIALANKCKASVHVVPKDEAGNPAGAEYDEAMHQFDMTLDQERPFQSFLADLLSTARAAHRMNGNGAQFGVFYDDVADPVQLVTVGSTVQGTFQPTYDFSQRVNKLSIGYMDAANNYNPTTRDVVNKYLVVTKGLPLNAAQVTMAGVTRWSQITRDAIYNLNKHAALRVPLALKMSKDAILWNLGQVVNVQHPLPQWGYGGKVRLSLSGDAVVNDTTHVLTPIPAKLISGLIYLIDLDQTLILFDIAHASYEVRVRLADGSGEEGQLRTVTAGAVVRGYLAVTVSVPFTSVPAYNDPVAFGRAGLSCKPYRCVSIDLDENSQRAVGMIEYNASIYAPTTDITIIDYSSLPTYGGPPPPIPSGSCVAHEDLSGQNDKSIVSTVIVQWQIPFRSLGYGFYGGATVEVSTEATPVNFVAFPGIAPGGEFRWPAAPHEIPLTFRVTPVSTAGRPNLAGAVLSNTLTCHGSASVPANVAGLVAAVEGDAYVWRWNDISREMQYEVRSSDASWGGLTAGGNLLYRGRLTMFRWTGYTTRSMAVYVKAFTPFDVYSATAATATATRPAPSPPTVGTPVVSETTIKIPVGAASATVGVVGIYLWASQTSGFTPDDSTRVAQIVGQGGGDFLFRTNNTAPWYFRVAAADPLSDRLHDYSYSSQVTASLLVIVPQNPSAVVFAANATQGRRRAVISPIGGPPAPLKQFDLYVNWTFTDTVNPAGYLVGFQVVVYNTGGSISVPYWESGLIANPGARTEGVPELGIDAADTYTAAVQAIYAGGIASSWVTSSGLALNPASGEDVLAQLKQAPGGGFYFGVPIQLDDGAGSMVQIGPGGISVVTADGTVHAPRRARQTLIRGATAGQWVPFNSPLLDPPLTDVSSGQMIVSKVHILAQMRGGSVQSIQPTRFPTRLFCGADEIQSAGFRVAMNQVGGGTLVPYRDTAPVPAGWPQATIAGRGSPMTLITGTTTPHDTLGKAAWYDPLSFNGSTKVLRDVLWFAADMPTVSKPDGTPYYVDLSFAINRDSVALAWNGTYASMQGFSYNDWGPVTLRAYTNGKRWRVPWTAAHESGIGNCYLAWWVNANYEVGTSSGVSAPTRVIMDAFETHYLSGGPIEWFNLGPEDVDLLIIEDN